MRHWQRELQSNSGLKKYRIEVRHEEDEKIRSYYVVCTMTRESNKQEKSINYTPWNAYGIFFLMRRFFSSAVKTSWRSTSACSVILPTELFGFLGVKQDLYLRDFLKTPIIKRAISESPQKTNGLFLWQAPRVKGNTAGTHSNAGCSAAMVLESKKLCFLIPTAIRDEGCYELHLTRTGKGQSWLMRPVGTAWLP